MAADGYRAATATAGEVAAAVVVPVGMLVLLWNWFVAYVCFSGSCGEPDTQHRVVYGVTAVVVLAAVAWTVLSASRRDARWAHLWHVPVGILAILAVLVLAVPRLEVERTGPAPEPSPWTGCVERSGGDSDCPGD